jgi:hypothetical protein
LGPLALLGLGPLGLKVVTGVQYQVHNFGEPFFLRVAETETLGEVKIRIRAKLEVRLSISIFLFLTMTSL